MLEPRGFARLRVLICGATALLCCGAPSRAEHLPLTTYTTSQGLAGNDVDAAVEDARGFLWVATERGLSRFDGREFRNFGKDRGLSDERVTSLVLAPDGQALWVGTVTAVYRFSFKDGVFAEIAVEGRRVPWQRTTLVVDRDGALWCGADGLYRLNETDTGTALQRVSLPSNVTLPYVNALAVDRGGDLWFAYEDLYRRQRDGRVERIRTDGSQPTGITSLAADRRGRIWITALGGFWTIDDCNVRAPLCRASRAIDVEVTPWAGPLWTADGGAWLGTSRGLIEIDSMGAVKQRISAEQGLVSRGAKPILLDGFGDLWIGSSFSGLQRLVSDGLTSFGREDGLDARLINSILITQAGELVAFGHPHVLQRLDGNPAAHAGGRTRPGLGLVRDRPAGR
jgi:ligand-binding sensor domain-containing protein